MDGEHAVTVIAGVKVCAHHAALTSLIAKNPSFAIQKREPRVSRILLRKCYCGKDFRWAKQQGAAPNWCP
jgi:hypothetical protein